MLHKWSKVSRGHFLRCWCVWWCWPWWRGGWWEPTQRKGVRHHAPWKARSSPPSSALLPGHITIIIINIFSWESQWWRGWWKWQICLDVRWWQQDVLWWRQDVYQISRLLFGGDFWISQKEMAEVAFADPARRLSGFWNIIVYFFWILSNL